MCVRERVYVCVREREKERESVCVFVCRTQRGAFLVQQKTSAFWQSFFLFIVQGAERGDTGAMFKLSQMFDEFFYFIFHSYYCTGRREGRHWSNVQAFSNV